MEMQASGCAQRSVHYWQIARAGVEPALDFSRRPMRLLVSTSSTPFLIFVNTRAAVVSPAHRQWSACEFQLFKQASFYKPKQ